MSVVVTSSQSNSTTAVTAPGIDTTGKAGIVVGTSAFHGSIVDAATPVTDSKGNTYTRVERSTLASSIWMGIYECLTPVVGTGHTFTYHTSTNADIAIAVLAFDDVSSPVLDQGADTTTSTNVANPAATAQITTTDPNEIIVSVYCNDDGSDTVTLGNGGSSAATWTKDVDVDGSLGMRITLGHTVVTSTGTYSASWTSNQVTTAMPRGIASFKSGGAGFDPSTVPWSGQQPDSVQVQLVEF